MVNRELKLKKNQKQFKYQWGLAAAFTILLLIIFSLTAENALGQRPDKSGLDQFAYLPAVVFPPPFPTPPASSVEAYLRITPTGGINASTFNPGTFIIINEAGSSQRISEVVIDLSTAAFPDMVFDPFGTAGDQVAKDVTIDSNPATVGFLTHFYSSPHDGGYDILTLRFNDFDPGETVAFSVDVDPTSIKGVQAPGPAESGSVSGLEMSGATVSVLFDNNLLIIGRTLPLSGSDSGSEAIIRENLPTQPFVTIENVPTTPATVASAGQVVQIAGGHPWSTAVIQIIEGGLFTAGLPNGGFDIDPYEANSAIQVNEYRQLVSYDGNIDIPVTLTKANAEGGLNHILVYFEDYHGYNGLPADPIILELSP